MVAREDHSAAHSALNDLCRKYWRPIYAFARHRGCAPHDAEDVTQAYLARLLERDYIQRANQERGTLGSAAGSYQRELSMGSSVKET